MYVQTAKQLFLCDVIRSYDNLLTPFLSFSPFYKTLEEKGKNEGLKERPW